MTRFDTDDDTEGLQWFVFRGGGPQDGCSILLDVPPEQDVYHLAGYRYLIMRDCGVLMLSPLSPA